MSTPLSGPQLRRLALAESMFANVRHAAFRAPPSHPASHSMGWYDELISLTEQVRETSWKVADDDIVRARVAGLDDDLIFEAILVGAVAAGSERLRHGMSVVSPTQAP